MQVVAYISREHSPANIRLRCPQKTTSDSPYTLVLGLPLAEDMSPSKDIQEGPGLDTELSTTKRRPTVIKEHPLELPTTSKANGEAKTSAEPKDTSKPVDDPKEGKLSGAEIKKRAKAEKAARRAQQKEERQPPVKSQAQESAKPVASGKPSHDISKGPVNGSSATFTPSSKGQHKRTGSMSVTSQKALPLRPTQIQTAPPPVETQRESKKVALFGHLYGHPRRTALAGAGKDVHPAVLALGLQMSSYVVCGSNARCIATLLVFKRVRHHTLIHGQAVNLPIGH